jgi:hypothetical protein
MRLAANGGRSRVDRLRIPPEDRPSTTDRGGGGELRNKKTGQGDLVSRLQSLELRDGPVENGSGHHFPLLVLDRQRLTLQVDRHDRGLHVVGRRRRQDRCGLGKQQAGHRHGQYEQRQSPHHLLLWVMDTRIQR